MNRHITSPKGRLTTIVLASILAIFAFAAMASAHTVSNGHTHASAAGSEKRTAEQTVVAHAKAKAGHKAKAAAVAKAKAEAKRKAEKLARAKGEKQAEFKIRVVKTKSHTFTKVAPVAAAATPAVTTTATATPAVTTTATVITTTATATVAAVPTKTTTTAPASTATATVTVTTTTPPTKTGTPVSTTTTTPTTPTPTPTTPAPAPNTAADGPTGDPGSWNTIFDDEFTGNTLDTTKWNPNWYGSSNTLPSNAAGSDDQSCANPANTTEANNELTLAVTAGTCTTDTGKTYPYSGSLINTWNKFSFTYGFLETKMYVPTNAAGQLINSVSFWADGTGTWPSTGELDVMELLQGCGPNGSAGYAYHFHSPSGGPGACAPQSFDTGGWHTFGADWEPGKVTYYYDGQNIGSITSGITASPMNLILSQAVDTTYTSTIVQPAQAQIKYVRVWQHN